MMVGGGLSDEELMLRVQADGREALGELFERYRQPLYGFLARLLRDVAWAEDLTLETFVRVYERRATYRGGGKFSTWLFAIAHNLAADRMRRLARCELPALQEAAREAEAGELPDDVLARAELAETVRTAVAALPVEHRTVILLREFEGFSYREIAEILGTKEETVRVRAFRARQALKIALAPYVEASAPTAVTFSTSQTYE